ncbi:hypothetical protein SAMN05421505_1036 [Sinosporangium album]|uniref:Uncharacterized protein n=1 Tax=Sinosporangium album TaxID=504805 RepID=A0A1G7SXQ4_9ACTN|nr:hypothetical protein [Sinosporangium album]SDG27652.1 hypothetical protein SAMN05421505_1036 [Sinosporangium album]
MMPIDPHADLGRRAWLACPSCHDGHDCADCLARRNCPVHWRYLLANQGHVVHLQCPSCTHLWAQDTR